MNLTMFRAAKKLKPKIEYKTGEVMTFTTGKYSQRFWRQDTMLKFSCTCEWGSLQGSKYQVICKHTLACLFKIINEELWKVPKS